MTYDKKDIMKQAWTRAKNLSFMEGGSAKEWFAYALKERWAFVKSLFAPKKAVAERLATETKVYKIKEWFVNKNFDLKDMSVYNDREKIETISETEKAVRLKISAWAGQTINVWVPKSCVEAF